MDIRNSILDIHNSIRDIRNSILDIRNSILDIHNSILDIRNSVRFLLCSPTLILPWNKQQCSLVTSLISLSLQVLKAPIIYI
jgi:hypothetical protein